MGNRTASRSRPSHDEFTPVTHRSRFVFGTFWGLLLAATFFVAGPWAGFHGILFAGVGLLIWFRPPALSLPAHWWLLAALFGIAGSAAFLPAEWFGSPDWRQTLKSLGVETGTMVAIQSRQAAEMLGLFAIMLVTSLWLAGHRASPSQVRT